MILSSIKIKPPVQAIHPFVFPPLVPFRVSSQPSKPQEISI